jgi:hypothetical protein
MKAENGKPKSEIRRRLENWRNYWIFETVSAPAIKPISPEERKLWEKHNIETLSEWRAIPLTKKIQMIEELEEIVRSMHGGKLPSSTDEHEGRTTL